MSKPSAVPDSIARWLSSGACDGSGDGGGFASVAGAGAGYGSGSGDGINTGSGPGFCDGRGHGDGDGRGYGDDSCDGRGDGFCDGRGYGSGYGSGIARLNGQRVWLIDGVPTIIDALRGDLARGSILRADLSLEPCYVARSGDYFAHGQTAREAMAEARAKAFEDEPDAQRIERFLAEFNPSERHSGHALLLAHGWLTGSCTQGRDAFVRDHEIDLDHTYTVGEFCSLTRNAYGSDVIRLLEDQL